MLKYEKLVLGELSTNCYLVWESESKEAVIIDPADLGVEISQEIQRLKLIPKVILATHGHFDHLLGAMELKLIFNIPLAISAKDEFLLRRQRVTAKHFLGYDTKVPDFVSIDIDLDKNNFVNLGRDRLKVIKTPGHTPGGVCFYSGETKIIFCGDLMFEGGFVGSTEHAYSSIKDLKESIGKILKLPKNTEILPGHGDGGTISSFGGQLGY